VSSDDPESKMSAQLVIELTNGNKLLFGGRGVVKGLSELAVGEQTAIATTVGFRTALANLADLVEMLEQTVGHLPKRPDKIEMQFGDSLSGECDLWIPSGAGEAEFKVTLTWGKENRTGV
jgi:hypothetical protein